MSRKKEARVWTRFREMSVDRGDVPASFKGMLDDKLSWRMFQNNLYTVQTAIEDSGMYDDDFPDGMPVLHISIRRNDRKTLRSWRDLQRIKSEIAGSDCDAMELFPAEGRLLDGANQYHLYALPPGKRFPFGEWTRSVADDEDMRELLAQNGATEAQVAAFRGKQEPFEWGKDVAVDEPGMVPGFSDLRSGNVARS